MKEGRVTGPVLKRLTAGILPDKEKDRAAVQTVCTAVMALESAQDGALPVVRAANRLCERGLKPSGITLTALLPERISEIEIKCLMRSIAAAPGAQDTVISDCALSVSGAVNQIVVTASAYGTERMERPKQDRYTQQDRPSRSKELPVSDRYLVQAGFAGLAGSALLAKYRRQELQSRLSGEFLDGCRSFFERISIRNAAEAAYRTGAQAVLEAYEGGIFSALWEIGDQLKAGMEIRLPHILMKQETVEICEYFDASPYQLLSGGCTLIVTDRPEELLRELKREELPCAVIGMLNNGNDRILCNQDEKRYLEPEKQDEYFRIRLSRVSR